jgi:hypothetical protein
VTRLTFGLPNRAKVVESFAPAGGRVLGALTLAIGVLILVDVVIEWRTWAGLTTAAIVVAVCTFVWLGLVRPCVAAYEDVLVLRNVLRDVRIPWNLVETVEISPVFRLVAGGRVYRSAAVALTGADRRALRRAHRGRVESMRDGGAAGPATTSGQAPSLGGDVSPSEYTIRRIESMARSYGENASRSTSGPSEVEYVWRWAEFALIGAAILLAVIASQLG